MIQRILRFIAGLGLLLLGLWLMGRSAYMSTVPIASVATALFGLLMAVVGLAMMIKRPWS